LFGENGAGKSTLVKIIYGVLKADAGVMRLRGWGGGEPGGTSECFLALIRSATPMQVTPVYTILTTHKKFPVYLRVKGLYGCDFLHGNHHFQLDFPPTIFLIGARLVRFSDAFLELLIEVVCSQSHLHVSISAVATEGNDDPEIFLFSLI